MKLHIKISHKVSGNLNLIPTKTIYKPAALRLDSCITFGLMVGKLETPKASNNLRNGTRKNVINSMRLTTHVGSLD